MILGVFASGFWEFRAFYQEFGFRVLGFGSLGFKAHGL